MKYTRFKSPMGMLVLTCNDDDRLEGIYFEGAPHAEGVTEGRREDPAPFRSVVVQLREYFAGTRTTFDLPLAARGTEFQQAVWAALRAIPYGQTSTYASIAREIGRPRAVRAVGAANGKNPLSIVVPCHRVVGHDGALTGYAGGLPNKRSLLALEGRAE